MPIPVVVPIVLGALGGGALWEWVKGPDDAWADSAVFNSRMREIHLGILQLNDLLARCEPIHTPDNQASLRQWRDFVKSWAAFYKEVGTVYLSPNERVIKEAKRKAKILAQWIDDYASICGGELPKGLAEIEIPDKEDPSVWPAVVGILGAAAIGTMGYLAFHRQIRSKSSD